MLGDSRHGHGIGGRQNCPAAGTAVDIGDGGSEACSVEAMLSVGVASLGSSRMPYFSGWSFGRGFRSILINRER